LTGLASAARAVLVMISRVIVAHVRATLDAPGGPLAGEHASIITVVLLKHGGGYEITAFHNTLITG
jgi:hypothetical protein